MSTLLSICIPTFNRSHKVCRLLDFVHDELLLISNADIEIIVADNASDDDTYSREIGRAHV